MSDDRNRDEARAPSSGSLRDKVHRLPLRVYYEDTDQQGHVFYANYLRYIERGRSEFLRCINLPPLWLAQTHSRQFVVASLTIDYRASAKLDEAVEVRTRLTRLSKVSLLMDQQVWRGERQLISAQVRLAIVDVTGRPAPMPAHVQDILAAQLIEA